MIAQTMIQSFLAAAVVARRWDFPLARRRSNNRRVPDRIARTEKLPSKALCEDMENRV